MNEPKSEQLDQLLRDWAAQHAADARTLDRLHGSICQALEHGGPAAGETPSAPESTVAASRQTWPHRTVWFSLGAAVALLLVISLSVFFSPGAPEVARPDPPNSEDETLLAEITSEQLAHEKQLFAELERIFGGQLQWVAESDGSIELGIDPDAAAEPGTDAKPVTMRFTVAKRRPHEHEWQVVWAVNLVARNEQVVQYRPDNADSPSLSVWTFALPDGKIACDATLSFDGDAGLHLTTSDLQSPGEVAESASTQEDGVEYRVFQAIQLLSGEVI